MSDSEKMGRCFNEVYERRGSPSELKIADALDRLAADVAAIKAKVDAVSPEDVKHFVESEKAWVKLVEEQRDAAIRERDEARAEVERLNAELAADVAAIKEAVCDGSVAEERDRFFAGWAAALKGRDKLRAEVERLKNELYDREQEILSLRADTVERYEPPAAPPPAAPEPAYYLVTNERDRPVHVSRMHPGVGWDGCTITALYAAPQPAAPPPGWLTDEERHILGAHLQSLRDQRRAMERGGQTLGYSANPCGLKREADAIDALLARAGSPPVVEVPALRQPGPMTIREKQIHVAYRDAMDAAGVAWKEVGRE